LQELTIKYSKQKDGQFDFLKPTNPLFEWFTGLVDLYSKCLEPDESLQTIANFAKSKEEILKKGDQKYQWEKY
jgi:hypothetical protein